MLAKTFLVVPFFLVCNAGSDPRNDCYLWSETNGFGDGCPDGYEVYNDDRCPYDVDYECTIEYCCQRKCKHGLELKEYACPTDQRLEGLDTHYDLHNDATSKFRLLDANNTAKVIDSCCTTTCRSSNNKAECPEGKDLLYDSTCDHKNGNVCNNATECCTEDNCLLQKCDRFSNCVTDLLCTEECKMMNFVHGMVVILDDPTEAYQRQSLWYESYADSDEWDTCVTCLEEAGTTKATKQSEVTLANMCLDCLFCKADLYGVEGSEKQTPPIDKSEIDDPRPLPEKKFVVKCRCPEDFPKCWKEERPGSDDIPDYSCYDLEDDEKFDDLECKICDGDYVEPTPTEDKSSSNNTLDLGGASMNAPAAASALVGLAAVAILN